MNLQKVLTDHQKYLGNEGGKRADLSNANLTRANLIRANLSEADLSEADLSNANLTRADLSEANLSEADLSEADLSNANLSRADLREADLRKADLREANLSNANLNGAKGITFIGFDKRGWILVCWWKNGKPYFTSGCHRNLTIESAMAHWGSDKYPDKARGEMYVSAVKFLAQLGEQK